MSDVTDIPIEDIKLFLSKNDINTSNGDLYNIAWKLIKSNKAKYYPDSVVEWMYAYNLHELNVKIPIYKRSDILTLSDTELTKLSKLLTMKTNNIDHIINILKYLHKLDETPIFPKEIIFEILQNSDIYDIEATCKISKEINLVCQSQEGKNLIISKFGGDSLDVSNYTFKELLFYSKILPFKIKIKIWDEIPYMYLDGKVYKFHRDGASEQNARNDINQILQYDDTSIAILTNDGKVYIPNSITRKPEELNLPEKVVGIFSGKSNLISFDIITLTGKVYKWFNNNVVKINGTKNIIQKNSNLYLNDQGELYSKLGDKFIRLNNLPKIKQLTNEGFILSTNGEIYKIDLINLDIKIYNDKETKNVKQIVFCEASYSPFHKSYYTRLLILYNDNKVSFLTFYYKIRGKYFPHRLEVDNIKELSNIIEIESSNKTYTALNNDNKLYIKYDNVKDFVIFDLK